MKNIIYYYYHIVPQNIYQTKNYFYFHYNNKNYILITYENNPLLLNQIYALHDFLINYGIPMHKIILNKDNNIITLINNKPYILLQILYENSIDYNPSQSKKITFQNLMPFINFIIPQNLITNKNSEFYLLARHNLSFLWAQKNDHLEYQINQNNNKYPLIKESFGYYIGLGETAISFINNNDIKNIMYCPSHKRINKAFSYFDLYNPLNLVIDSRVRDAAEYFKSLFFQNENIENQISNFLKKANLIKDEYIVFFARMLYPTYYFDIIENIIDGTAKEEELKKIIDKVNDYEKLLKNIYQNLKQYIRIEIIEWLE